MYNHLKVFKKKAVYDEQLDNIQVNERKIRAHIDDLDMYDDTVYSHKKIKRKDLEAEVDSDEDEEIDSEEYGSEQDSEDKNHINS